MYTHQFMDFPSWEATSHSTTSPAMLGNVGMWISEAVLTIFVVWNHFFYIKFFYWSAWVGQSQPRKFQSRARSSNNTIFFVGYFRKESGRFTAGWWFVTWILWLSFQLGISSSQLTKSYIFQRSRLKPPTRYIIIYNPIKPPLNHH